GAAPSVSCPPALVGSRGLAGSGMRAGLGMRAEAIVGGRLWGGEGGEPDVGGAVKSGGSLAALPFPEPARGPAPLVVPAGRRALAAAGRA
ncbi:MAG: hypothetical protein U1D06_06765, partial [Paracoccaceae bacterium]|nr:hypothetical protein [Paracoccaceae bacterium]